jgi:hypothetical protein
MIIFQQRAPLFKGKRNQFVQLLSEFIQAEKFKETICLTSSNAMERLDSQLIGYKFHRDDFIQLSFIVGLFFVNKNSMSVLGFNP